jgi:hypothetical protein
MDVGTDSCPWQIRDLPGWRENALLTASADILVTWHTATLSREPAAMSPAADRLYDVIDEIRHARLAGDLDCLEAACRRMADLSHGSLPASPLLDALSQLRLNLASLDADPAQLCLIQCPTCSHLASHQEGGR